jgi:hypothetical protein
VEATRKTTPVSTKTILDGSGMGATLGGVPADAPGGLLEGAPDGTPGDSIPGNMPIGMPIGANNSVATSGSVGRLGGGDKYVDMSAKGPKSIDVVSVAAGSKGMDDVSIAMVPKSIDGVTGVTGTLQSKAIFSITSSVVILYSGLGFGLKPGCVLFHAFQWACVVLLTRFLTSFSLYTCIRRWQVGIALTVVTPTVSEINTPKAINTNLVLVFMSPRIYYCTGGRSRRLGSQAGRGRIRTESTFLRH